MGGGHWNGKNHGGEHTGNGKKLHTGHYCNNGYRRDQSMIKFKVGDTVFYTGTNKNKSQYYIPNGTCGVIMEKENSNKLLKTSRSLMKVDFNDHGIRYVKKDLLQHDKDYTLFIQTLSEMDNMGYQNPRNNKKKLVKDHYKHQNYERILNNRKHNKGFREWRKNYLDALRISLFNKRNYLNSNPDINSKKKREIELKQLMLPIKKKDTLTECESKQLKEYQKEISDIDEYLKKNKKEYETLDIFLSHHDNSRQYVRNVSSAYDYNKLLHEEYNKVNPKEEAYIPTKKSKKQPVKKNVNIDLLKWGLYPSDVRFH